MSSMNAHAWKAKDVPSRDPPRSADRHHHDGDPPGILSIGTLVIWLGCLAVGVGGFLLRYPRPSPPVKPLAPVQAQLLKVELTRQSLPSPDVGAPSAPPPQASMPEPPPPPPAPPATPAAPPLVAVAKPSPEIPFAIPVEGPTRTVEPKRAVPVQPAPVAATAPAAEVVAPRQPDPPRQLTFGEGEGKQPAPEYPREAIIARQQGTVGLRFTVDAGGRVTNVEVRSPCHAPLLNQAAARAVRETWRFAAGPPRTFDVSIQFELKPR